MPTKLSKYCDGVMEAAWLSAVILIPIYFNIYSSRIFEPDKIAILRSLAMLILACWLIKIVDGGGVRWGELNKGAPLIRQFLGIPLVAPVIALAGVYAVSTIFSVTPRVSFWGSYQRLQGTYTTFSYLVVFLAMVGNLRRKEQIDRLITTIVLTSLPVTLYGILQRYQIDPIPWGGDTTRRIAANMGNSIFVAAYLIMVFPLTIGRIVQSFSAILKSEHNLWSQMARGTIYVFTAAVQVMAIYMSASRGPALGWLAGSFFLLLLLSLYWQKRWLTLGIIGSALILAVFLLIFNLPGGPLEGLRDSPAIGRFGLLLDAESNSALVRKYIWQGAADLVAPHEPLEFPDGSKDPYNALRLLIGYGPESMYVAYNPFYVPELAQVERRNASPDRSHNESWDALVITGVSGLLVYLALFSLIFYYGLKWVGIISSQMQQKLFFLLLAGGGAAGAIVFGLWQGIEYFGVGLPFGMLLGLLGYLTIAALFSRNRQIPGDDQAFRSITLIVVIAGIVAHFVEINFGIAIASTRTNFWAYSALLICVGYIAPQSHNLANRTSEAHIRLESQNQSRKKRRPRSPARSEVDFLFKPLKDWFPPAMIVTVMMVGLGYDLITNPNGLTNPFALIWQALTRLPNRGSAVSFGVMAMVLTVWLMASLVHAIESTDTQAVNSSWQAFIWVLLISGGFTLIYWGFHANSLATIAGNVATTVNGVLDQVSRYQTLLARFYLYVYLMIFVAAFFLGVLGANVAAKVQWLSLSLASAVVLMAIYLAGITNVRVIQADIAFKLADPFTSGNQWPVAIQIYTRANALAPNEDHYYLFLGRAYLEYAKLIEDRSQQEVLIKTAEIDLQKAQRINPLNTDHTANLARLYNLWSTLTADPEERRIKAEKSTEYFSRAVVLSPKNARLWDEWALLYLNVFKQPAEANQRLKRAMEIDPNYHWTYALMGEAYSTQAKETSDPSAREQYLHQAVEAYTQAIQLPAPGDALAKYNYSLALGATYIQLNMLVEAIEAYQQAIEAAPQNLALWRVEETVANLYTELGDLESASLYLSNALLSAPDDQIERLRNALSQLELK